jgi:LmbE family N-acetylglucosaminyl deacetylase
MPKPLEIPQEGMALVLAPHSDDETFGCGGTLVRLREAGWHVKVVVITDGARGDPAGFVDGSITSLRRRETMAALAVLGIDDVDFLGEPDGDLTLTAALSERLGAIVSAYAADWWLVPPVLDFHRDHINASLLAVDLWQSRGCRERLFFYELWQPLPCNRIVDITTALPVKHRAMIQYGLPMHYKNYGGAFASLAAYRGFYLEGHSDQYAEALLEVDAQSWRQVVSNLMGLRARQAAELA